MTPWTRRREIEAAEYLRDKADLVSVDPGQAIFRQGDHSDNYYISRLGFVKVTQQYGRNERVLNYLGPGNGFGEIGLLSGLESLAFRVAR